MVPFWWPRLLQDPIFQQQLKIRWQLLRSSELSNSSVLNLVQNTADYLIETGWLTVIISVGVVLMWTTLQ